MSTGGITAAANVSFTKDGEAKTTRKKSTTLLVNFECEVICFLRAIRPSFTDVVNNQPSRAQESCFCCFSPLVAEVMPKTRMNINSLDIKYLREFFIAHLFCEVTTFGQLTKPGLTKWLIAEWVIKRTNRRVNNERDMMRSEKTRALSCCQMCLPCQAAIPRTAH